MRKGKDPELDEYLWLMEPVPDLDGPVPNTGFDWALHIFRLCEAAEWGALGDGRRGRSSCCLGSHEEKTSCHSKLYVTAGTCVCEIRLWLFTLMWVRIRLLLLIKGMQISEHLSTDPPRLHFEPPWLHERLGPSFFEPQQFMIFCFNVDPDSAFDFDLDPAGSGSGFSLLMRIQISKTDKKLDTKLDWRRKLKAFSAAVVSHFDRRIRLHKHCWTGFVLEKK